MMLTEEQKEIFLQGRFTYRDNIRAIMRGEEVDDWQAEDIIREITEWHDAGRPQVAKMTLAERKAFFGVWDRI